MIDVYILVLFVFLNCFQKATVTAVSCYYFLKITFKSSVVDFFTLVFRFIFNYYLLCSFAYFFYCPYNMTFCVFFKFYHNKLCLYSTTMYYVYNKFTLTCISFGAEKKIFLAPLYFIGFLSNTPFL